MRNVCASCLFLLLLVQPAGGEAAPSSPGPRWGHVFVHDPVRDVVLLFGGAAKRGSYAGDTWTWDGGRWTRWDVPGPSPRGFAAAAFDDERQVVVLHGGRGTRRVTHSGTVMVEITTCPTCNSERIRRVRRDWKDEHQGAVYEVPDLEYFECPDCGEKIYDRRAMRKIEAHSPAFSRPTLQRESA